MTVLWSKCGDIVYIVVIDRCYCGGIVVAVPLWQYYGHCRYGGKMVAQ